MTSADAGQVRVLKQKVAELEAAVSLLRDDLFSRYGGRPLSTEVKCQFVEAMSGRVPVTACCRFLSISPRTYYAWRQRPPSARTVADAYLVNMLRPIYAPRDGEPERPERPYGAGRMWAWLRQQNVPVARCTVERIMRENGWSGRRGVRYQPTLAPGASAGYAPCQRSGPGRQTE